MVLAVVLVTAVTIDLGPWSRRSKRRRAARTYLERPLHIGSISFRLYTGNFVFEDLVIEGLTPQSRPFLTAKRVEVSIPWTTLFDKRFVLRSVEMIDWKMYVEIVEGGKHSLPRLAPTSSSDRKSGWTTTLEWVRAHRGEFTFEDHAAPWSVITRNLDVTVARPGSEYRGQASFSNGLVAIQSYVPFRADMKSSFRIDGTRVVLEKIDMITDGARSSVHGDVNLKYWPEQSFRVESTYDMRAHAGAVLRQRGFRALRQRSLRRVFPPVQGADAGRHQPYRARAVRHVCQRSGRGRAARCVEAARTAVPFQRPARLRALDAGETGGHRRECLAVRRSGAVQL